MKQIGLCQHRLCKQCQSHRWHRSSKLKPTWTLTTTDKKSFSVLVDGKEVNPNVTTPQYAIEFGRVPSVQHYEADKYFLDYNSAAGYFLVKNLMESLLGWCWLIWMLHSHKQRRCGMKHLDCTQLSTLAMFEASSSNFYSRWGVLLVFCPAPATAEMDVLTKEEISSLLLWWIKMSIEIEESNSLDNMVVEVTP